MTPSSDVCDRFVTLPTICWISAPGNRCRRQRDDRRRSRPDGYGIGVSRWQPTRTIGGRPRAPDIAAP